MPGPMKVERLRSVSRLAAVGLLGSLAAACSSESLRLSGDPFGNPFKSGGSAEPSMTGTVASPEVVTTAPVSAKPLAAPAPSHPRPVASSSQAVPTSSGPGGWSAHGGTTVTVGSGENLAGVANRYGVPPQAILSANGLSSGAQVTAGKSLVIPVYNASGASAQAAHPAPAPKFKLVEGPKPAAQPVKAAEPKSHVRPGQQASAKPVAKPEPVKQAKTEPAKPVKAEPVKQAKVEAPKPAKAEPVKVAKAEPAKPQKVAALETKPVEAPKAAAAPAQVAAKPEPKDEPKATGALPADPAGEFRWPARGRVIAGFGANGGNEGINIAVPEGTPVKAAESGTVTYAGNEVKGYGNLVLIKHDNGFVSAYAHNGELSVKRGEKVKRGQLIAKAGQTGNVTSPQLHFEIRKGQTPIDPTPHLAN
jgi:murein DD-endopeptidase MepM/ murein hydrolase activator NlpD